MHRSPLMPTGVLLFCLDYASKDEEGMPGVFASVRRAFRALAGTDLPKLVKGFYEFRNTYIAHTKAELVDRAAARRALGEWLSTLVELHKAVEG